jgi:putative phosphotransacetylase
MDKILVEVSARHVHLTREALEALFGGEYELTPKRELSQPGQFACEERVDIIGPKRELKGVSILGPLRGATQVEISLTDARAIGTAAPIRESGDISGSPGCKIAGPKGEIEISEGVIAAKRHVHLDAGTAKRFGLADKEIIGVRIDTPGRALEFGDVVVRVSDSFAPAMHIDTDEGNAAAVSGEVYGEIIKQ